VADDNNLQFIVTMKDEASAAPLMLNWCLPHSAAFCASRRGGQRRQ
jgi:hypothetical protein